MAVTAAFEALADDTRHRVVELLAQREQTAGELAAQFTISRPAVSRHLRVLRNAGLVQYRDDAQRRIYGLEPKAFEEVANWIDNVRSGWSARLDLLVRHLDATRVAGHEEEPT